MCLRDTWQTSRFSCPAHPSAERDELRASMQELLGRLSAANSLIDKADGSMQALQAQLEEAVAARCRAEEEAAAARQEAQGLREVVSDLQVGWGWRATPDLAVQRPWWLRRLLHLLTLFSLPTVSRRSAATAVRPAAAPE